MNPITKTNRIDECVRLINDGIKAWVKAGEIIVEEHDADPDFLDKISARHPQLTDEILRRFEQIGRRAILPELLVSDCPGYKVLRRLPYEVQSNHLQRGFELVIRSGNTWDIMRVDAANLTKEQARQVADQKHLRSPAEQRAFIESERTFTWKPSDNSMPYKIKNGRLVVNSPVEFTRKELARLLAEMEQ